MPDNQTVEDLGKLVKSKYPGSYDSINDAELGNKIKAKYPDAYGHFTDIPVGVKPPPQGMIDKVKDIAKSFAYDPTIGSIGQGMRDLTKEGSRLKGAHEIISGAEKSLIPLGAVAAVTNPEVTLPAVALGMGGQYLGTKIPQLLGAGEDVSNIIGDISGLAAGGLGGKVGPRVPSALKVAAPDVAAGGGKALAGIAASELFPAGPGRYLSRALLTYPGLKQAGRGLIEGGKELFKGPVEAPKAVSPSPPNAQGMADMMSALKPKEALPVEAPPGKSLPIGPQELKQVTPRTLSLGNLKASVKSGLMDLDEFNSSLAEQGYNETDRFRLTELLKRSIEDEEETETSRKEAKAKTEVKHPSESKKTEVKTPEHKEGLTHDQVQNDPKVIKNLKIGDKMTHKDGSTWTLKEIPIDKIDPDPGNRVDQNRVNYYKGQQAPPVELKPGEVGRYKVFEGHHRITAASQKGETNVKAWVPEEKGEENPFLEKGAPYKPPITEKQIEESQSDAREAKENKLARHFANNKDIDLSKIPRTSEYLRAVSKEAGLKREASLRTLENAIKKAIDLRRE